MPDYQWFWSINETTRAHNCPYVGNKYLKKNNGEKLKISVMTGRNNHECLFLKESALIKIKREISEC